MKSVAWLITVMGLLAGLGCQTHRQAGADEEVYFTHGPVLGRVEAHRMGVWARTARTGKFAVRYGTQPGRLDSRSPEVATRESSRTTRVGFISRRLIPAPNIITGWSGWISRER